MSQTWVNVTARVPGTAVVLAQTVKGTPPVLLWYLKHSHALQETLFILTVSTALVPSVPEETRLDIEQIAENFWHARAHFGFMDRQDIPALLKWAREQGCALDPTDVTYFVGRVAVIRAPEKSAFPGWIATAFAFLQRNSAHATDYFHLPMENVIEIGREVAL